MKYDKNNTFTPPRSKQSKHINCWIPTEGYSMQYIKEILRLRKYTIHSSLNIDIHPYPDYIFIGHSIAVGYTTEQKARSSFKDSPIIRLRDL